MVKCLEYNNETDCDSRNAQEATNRGCDTTIYWWNKRVNNTNTKFVLEVNNDTLNEGEVTVNINFADEEWNY